MKGRISYRLLFSAFLCSILIVFFVIRPLNSPWHRFIAGDGVGYYVYLPSTFIHHDSQYKYEWFNQVFEKEYACNLGANHSENFMVEFEGRMVNKYYPGLSLLWLPFFAIAHVCALVFQFPANGFSLPYQWAIGAASISYLFLGLFYLRKLMFRLYGKASIAFIVPVLIFYGTFLFEYSLNLNSLSHVYSFTFITLFCYYLHKTFHQEEDNFYYLLLSLVFYAIVISIRPLNALVLFLFPAFITKQFSFRNLWPKSFQYKYLIPIGFAIGIVIRFFFILKGASGSVFPNTYSAEPFQFSRPELLKAAFGYQYGLFLYAPLLLVALFSSFIKTNRKKSLFISFFFLFLLYIYASWWFWPIVSRALIDFYVLPSLLLAALLNVTFSNKRQFIILGLLLLACCGYYLFKQFQFKNGVFEANTTYGEIYWKRFFKCHKRYTYDVPPYSILQKIVHVENFESGTYSGAKDSGFALNGTSSALLNAQNDYTKEFTSQLPDFLFEKGISKIQFSFFIRAQDQFPDLQLYMNFYSVKGEQKISLPFYLKSDYFVDKEWTEMQFGYEFTNEELKGLKDGRVAIYLWNPSPQKAVNIDSVKTCFFLCDRSAEIVP